MPERRRVLHMGPNPEIGGGMAAALRALLGSPLAEEYELDVVATYRRPDPLDRLRVFLGALARLAGWSLRRRGRIVHVHAKDCTVTYRQSGRKMAVLTIGRDHDSLAAEIELEKVNAVGS